VQWWQEVVPWVVEPHSQGMGQNLLDTTAAEVKDFVICVLYLKNITFQ